jgi:predicted lipoprotein
MFTSAGDGKPFLIPGDALSIALAEDVNATERLLRDQISIPSGYFEGGAKPERLAAWRSNSTRDAFLATLEGFRAALAAGGSASFADLVATRDGLVSKRDPALAAAIRKQLGTIKEEIADLGGRDLVLYNELKRKPAMLKDLYDRIQVLQEQLIEASLVLELDVRSPVETQGK